MALTTPLIALHPLKISKSSGCSTLTNLLQWKEINPLKGSVKVLEEGMAALHLKEEEMKAQMAALDMKTRELVSGPLTPRRS